MLSRQNRFRGRASLNLVFRRGAVTRGSQLSLRFYPGGRSDLRAAVVISRKTHKSAVVRNRIRRRIYAFLEIHMAELKKGDLVITVHDPALAEAKFADFQKILETLLKRAHILS